MKIKILADAGAVAREAAAVIAEEARAAVAARGRFIMAVSGGRTPWLMVRNLASEEVPWGNVHVVQTDERVAFAGHLTETSPICVKAFLSMLRLDRIRSTPCRWSRLTWRLLPRSTRLRSGTSPRGERP
jgi:6-phosphogluconolactonase/glucosamine-6-phosphate isomerase/deaminase